MHKGISCQKKNNQKTANIIKILCTTASHATTGAELKFFLDVLT